MLKLHPEPGHLYHQVADDRDHIGCGPTERDGRLRWAKLIPRRLLRRRLAQGLKAFKSESERRGEPRGALRGGVALGYQIWKDPRGNSAYARSLLRAGVEATRWGARRRACRGTLTARRTLRGDETWADTWSGRGRVVPRDGERRYLADAARYARRAAAESWCGRAEQVITSYTRFMNVGHFRLYEVADVGGKELAGFYRECIERCVKAGAANPYGVGVPFIWCSNNLVTALATQVLSTSA